MTDGCLLCDMETAAPDAVVFRDALWAAEVAPGYEVPGWFFLRVRRHAELLAGLDDAELSAFGHRARDLVAAVTEATGAPATYLLHFGENYRHFHALVPGVRAAYEKAISRTSSGPAIAEARDAQLS